MSTEKYKKLVNLTVKNIFRKKLRSTLTILSVIIGIASVVALLVLSDGLFNAVSEEFNKMGANSIFVMPISGSMNGAGSNGSARMSLENMLKMQDVKNLKKIAEVEDAFAMNLFTAKVEYKNEEQFLMVISAPSENIDSLLDFTNLELKSGKTFNNREGNYAVIGPYVAEKIFKRQIKLGDTIKLNGEEFKVIGVLEPIGNQQDDSVIYISYNAGKKIGNYEDTVNSIVLKSKTDVDGELVVKKVKKELNRTRDKDSYIVVTAESILGLIERVLNMMRAILVAIAGISLVVASLGIINSVYTSVLERTREIGVLKSIGAKVSDITFMFVLESVLLTLVGGVIGFFGGLGIAKLVVLYAETHGFTMLTITVTPALIGTVLLLSLIVGLISGFFPARSAAKLNIVDALRQQ